MNHIIVLGFLTLFYHDTYAAHSNCSDSSGECVCHLGWWGRNCEYPRECLIPGDNGVHYRGTQNVTRGGLICDPWDLRKPKGEGFMIPPDGPHHNFCRHADKSPNTWCYVTKISNSTKRWEFCNIPMCDTQCEPPEISQHVKLLASPQSGFVVNAQIKFACEAGYTFSCKPLECLIPGDNGVHYRGTQNVTSDGLICDPWDLPGGDFGIPPDGRHHNYCRHVKSDRQQNTWCYVTLHSKKRWSTCNISLCDPALVSSNNPCSKGYHIADSILCTSRRKWSASVPTCTDINECTTKTNPCSSPNTVCLNTKGGFSCGCSQGYVRDGHNHCVKTCESFMDGKHSKVTSIQKRQYIEGDILTIQCDKGYTTNSSTALLCQANGSWNGSMPSCEVIKCKLPTLNKYSNILNTSTNVAYSERITIECHDGYIMNGTSVLTCQENRHWDHATPTCQVIKCNLPPLKSNSYIVKKTEVVEFKKSITIECQTGYKMNGTGRLTCQADLSWNHETPFCQVILGPANFNDIGSPHTTRINTFSNKRLQRDSNLGEESKHKLTRILMKTVPCNIPSLPSNTGLVSPQSSYVYKDQVSLTCVKGFELKDRDIITCLANSTWGTIPECTVVKCKDLSLPRNALILQGNKTEYQYLDKVTVGCDQTFEFNGTNTTTCLHTGQWQQITFYCKRMKCRHLNLSSNLLISNPLKKEYYYKDKVTFQCREGYKLSHSNSLECQADKMWDKEVPFCIEICGGFSTAQWVGIVFGCSLMSALVAAFVSILAARRLLNRKKTKDTIDNNSVSKKNEAFDYDEINVHMRDDHHVYNNLQE